VSEKPAEKTVPVSVYVSDRVIIRALAGAADELPAATVRRAVQALRAADPRAEAIAALTEAGGAVTGNTSNPRKPPSPPVGRDGAGR
jgi:hypothetical protein